MSTSTSIVTGQVGAGATCAFTALVKQLSGTPFTPDDISSITVTITDLGTYSSATPAVVPGYNGIALDKSEVMFTATTKTYNSKTYQRNFEWIPTVASQPFKTAGHTYKVTIIFTPSTAGFCSPLIFQIRAI